MNHYEEAERLLKQIGEEAADEISPGMVAEAQAHALLAVADQVSRISGTGPINHTTP